MANECDYLVIGSGATGMAFSDTLLQNSEDPNLRVIMVDKHETPAGQWHDSYDFVQLHQPSSMYGVESKKLETTVTDDNSSADHRATRLELIQYYADVQRDLETKYDFEFVGNTTLDLAQLYDGNPSRQEYIIINNTTGVSRTIHVRKRLVDARNMEPDLPISTPPKFSFPADLISVLPVNDIVNNNGNDNESNKLKQKHFVVVGGGKTGMDAVSHLLTEKNVSPENLLWVVPNDAWITARESIGNCIDLLYTSAKLHDASSNNNSDEKKEIDADTNTNTNTTDGTIGSDFFQRGFIEWEKQGHIYRLDPSIVPTKFKDATLSMEELIILQKAVPHMIRAGRISEITNQGSMIFQDGPTMELPFPVENTLFIHCSAGAFHFTKSNNSPPPIFEKRRIVVQDIYGTPGFCFVGSMLGKLESMTSLSDEERNAMTLTPKPSPCDSPLGKSGGDVIGAVSQEHPFIQRAHNLRMWLQQPKISQWMFQNRLFHLAHDDPVTVSDKVNYIFKVLEENGVVIDN